MTAASYSEFLDQKRHHYNAGGLELSRDALNPALFDFQAELVRWALNQQRAALFADTGLGKTPMQLEWADQVVRHTGGNVLILTPLAVGHQTVAEGEKFGIEARRSSDGTVHRGITVTNYERLHYFDAADFVALVCDESAILKAFDGVTRQAITAFMRSMDWRLLCSATPAPNDYTELGTSSEALGYLGHMDMLNRFFRNMHNTSDTTNRKWRAQRRGQQGPFWRFKGHAEDPFWRWVCSWARAIRKPSDLGYDDGDFALPPLIQNEHVVTNAVPPPGMLFAVDAISLHEQRQERRRTIGERCGLVADLVRHDQPALVWCHLNDEGNLLERLIPDAVQVSGADSDDAKEEKLIAFAAGEARVLITKPSIAGWGLNFQHCSHVTFFPSHSFEQYYQGVRRCWRFGQKNSVTVDIVTTHGEQRVLDNLQRKAADAERMFASLVAAMGDHLNIERKDNYTQTERLPAWL